MTKEQANSRVWDLLARMRSAMKEAHALPEGSTQRVEKWDTWRALRAEKHRVYALAKTLPECTK